MGVQGAPTKGGEQKDVAGGQLDAGRIMERSRSERSGQDLSQPLFGSTTGEASAYSLHHLEPCSVGNALNLAHLDAPSSDNAELLLHRSPLWRAGSPSRDAQNERNQEHESEQGKEQVQETPKHQSQRDRSQRYAEMLSQQEQEEARARIREVRLFGSCRFVWVDM